MCWPDARKLDSAVASLRCEVKDNKELSKSISCSFFTRDFHDYLPSLDTADIYFEEMLLSMWQGVERRSTFPFYLVDDNSRLD